jgi:hypothetical protein
MRRRRSRALVWKGEEGASGIIRAGVKLDEAQEGKRAVGEESREQKATFASRAPSLTSACSQLASAP